MSDNPLNLPPTLHHLYDLVSYRYLNLTLFKFPATSYQSSFSNFPPLRCSLRPHGTALWRLDRVTGALERLLDLPGCGDTGWQFNRLLVVPSVKLKWLYTHVKLLKYQSGDAAFITRNGEKLSNSQATCLTSWAWLLLSVSPFPVSNHGTLLCIVGSM